MNILVTGDYDPEYNRTKVLLTGLKEIGISVDEFPYKKFTSEVKKILSLKSEKADIIYLPPFTHKNVKELKKLTKKPLYFDPLISKYMTKVFDYKQVSRFSPRAIKNFYKDKVPLRLGDVILADTHQHKVYFVRKFKISPDKVHVLPIGVIENDFHAQPKKTSHNFKIGFYGGFIPLQGVTKIIEAANILKNYEGIDFELIGSGFEFEVVQKLVNKYGLKNIAFPGFMDYANLANAINNFDLCLGIFGETMKTELVIPNKIYHYAAMGKCILTKDTPAIKEVFEDGNTILLCDNDPDEIARKILWLRDEQALRNKIGKNAHQLIASKYNEREIAHLFLNIVKKTMPA